MSLLQRLRAAFCQSREPSELEVARRERRRCAEAYADAWEREDTRDVHLALTRFRRATNLVPRLEREVGA